MSNSELLALVETKLGSSPIIDELAARLEEVDDALDYDGVEAESMADAAQRLLEDLGAELLPQPDKDPRAFSSSDKPVRIVCPTCEASRTLMVDSGLLPE